MSDLLKAISAAGEKDLTEVRAKIDGLQKELEGLRQVEKILAVKIHGKPERAAPGTGGRLATRIAQAIREDGPATIDDLAATLDAKPQAVRMAIQRAGRQFVLVGGNRYQLALPAKN